MYEVCSNFQLKSRTFERGVEDETWSCGTGATAVALHFALQHTSQEAPVVIQTLGGNLKVYFERSTNGFKNVFLEGPATFVYSGELQ
jgi:diaminopimelate epimerase